MNYSEILTLGRKINNRLLDSSTWLTTSTHKFVVPTGKRWFVLGGIVNRSDAATLEIKVADTSDLTIDYIDTQAAGTGITAWPNDTVDAKISTSYPKILDAGERISLVFGAAQGATAYISCIVIEVNI